MADLSQDIAIPNRPAINVQGYTGSTTDLSTRNMLPLLRFEMHKLNLPSLHAPCWITRITTDNILGCLSKHVRNKQPKAC